MTDEHSNPIIMSYCTRPSCFRDNRENPLSWTQLTAIHEGQQHSCSHCQMPLILDGQQGRYLPIKALNSGGFGRIFLAWEIQRDGTRQRCVVKQFYPDPSWVGQILAKTRESFAQEAEILKELGRIYRKFPQLKDFCVLSPPIFSNTDPHEFIYLVQEYIEGQNLQELLQEKPQQQFSEQEVIVILKEMLELLQIIHEKNLIHRDIKPQNIMLDKHGQLYLVDFGASKALKSVEDVHSNILAFTLGFSPPDQQARIIASKTIDLYSLGVTCIYLLTGQFPPSYRAAQNDPNWQQWQEKAIGFSFYGVLKRMIAYNASDRFQSAQDVLNALDTTIVSLSPISDEPKDLMLLVKGGLTGLEGGLLLFVVIAFASSLATVLIGTGFWLLILLALIAIQSRIWCKWYYLLAIVGITFIGILFFQSLGIKLFAFGIIGMTIGLLIVAIFDFFESSNVKQ